MLVLYIEAKPIPIESAIEILLLAPCSSMLNQHLDTPTIR